MPAYCARDPLVITGTADQLREFLCGPQQYDAHCRDHRWHRTMMNINPNYLHCIAERQAQKRRKGK